MKHHLRTLKTGSNKLNRMRRIMYARFLLEINVINQIERSVKKKEELLLENIK
jgi:hypothetical protein